MNEFRVRTGPLNERERQTLIGLIKTEGSQSQALRKMLREVNTEDIVDRKIRQHIEDYHSKNTR